jgi:hypothetical protein
MQIQVSENRMLRGKYDLKVGSYLFLWFNDCVRLCNVVNGERRLVK